MKRLNKYANKRFMILILKLKKYKQSAKPEDLHQVRVELKKIKMLFDLLAFSSDNFNIAFDKSLQRIFKKAAQIREYEVLHQLVKKYNLIKFEKDIFPKEKNKRRVILKFRGKTGEYEKAINKIHKKTEKHLTRLSKQSLQKYLSRIEFQINKSLLEKFNKNKLHIIRKQVKKVIYLV